ncbi:MAG TPA: hypothetical protein VIG80_12370 [Bacillaceae bacterium]
MKTFLVTAMGAALLATGGASAIGSHDVKAQDSTVKVQQAWTVDATQGEEYATLAAKVDAENYKLIVTEDNAYKRVILLKDQNGRAQYKSIYMKDANTLKIVDFRGGIVFNGVIEKEAAEPAQAETAKAGAADEFAQYEEYAVLASKVDVNKYQIKVVEDNQGKRVIALTDSNGRVHYKSIFVKYNSWLKIVDTKQGLVYNGQI